MAKRRPGDDAAFASRVAKDGYLVVSIDYRHAPQSHWPAQIDDVRAAIDWVVAHAGENGGDSQHIGLLGRSSGAQLALVAAYTEPARIDAVVSFYGPTHLVEGWRDPPNPDPLPVRPSPRSVPRRPPEDVRANYEAASPMTYVSKRVPPTLLVYGARDHVVEARFGRELNERLKAAGATSIYLELPWAEHTFDKVPGVSAWVTAVHMSSGSSPSIFVEPRSGYPMITLQPVTLEGHGVRLEPMTPNTPASLDAAVRTAAVGALVYGGSAPAEVGAYIATALDGATRRPHAALGRSRPPSGAMVGSTRYHDIVPADRSRRDRLHLVREARGSGRTSTRPASCCCSRTRSRRSAARWSGCARTASTSDRSARSSGWARGKTASSVITATRKDGSPRDSVMYSILASEWPDVRRHLEARLARRVATPT